MKINKNTDFRPILKALHDQSYLLDDREPEHEESVLELIAYGILILFTCWIGTILFFSLG